MRVKVGDNWYDVTAKQPIMVELSAEDKANISNMPKWATKYASFEDGAMTVPERQRWMEAKERTPITIPPGQRLPEVKDNFWLVLVSAFAAVLLAGIVIGSLLG